MSITHGTAQGYLETAITAVGTGDFQAAWTAIAQAELALSAIPDTSLAGDSIRIRTSIDSVKKALEEAESRADDQVAGRVVQAGFRRKQRSQKNG